MSKNYEQLLDFEEQPDQHSIPVDTNAELEFQNFILSSAEEGELYLFQVSLYITYRFQISSINFMLDLIAGKIPTSQGGSGGVSSSKPLLNKSSNSPTLQQPQGLPPPATQSQPTGSSQFWKLNFWAHYFRIETKDVLYRITQTFLPLANYQDVIGDNPDLYGPIWIPITLSKFLKC